MESRIVDLDGPVHVADFGGDGPAMVLVHGLGGSHLNWMRVGGWLARGARVRAVDLAGFGRTPPAGRSSDVRDNRGLLDRLVREVVGSPAILVGSSMGGLIAMMEAAEAPEAVAGLVLVDPAQPRPPSVRPDPVVAAAFATYLVPGVGESFLRRRAARLGPEGLVDEAFRMCTARPEQLPDEVVEAHVALARDRLRSMPWAHEAFLQATRSLLRLLATRGRFRRLVERITAPTLLVHGDADRLVAVEGSRALAAERPDWTYAELAGIGHLPMLEDPEGFLRVLEGWLAGPGRAALVAAAGPGVPAPGPPDAARR